MHANGIDQQGHDRAVDGLDGPFAHHADSPLHHGLGIVDDGALVLTRHERAIVLIRPIGKSFGRRAEARPPAGANQL